MKYEDALAHMKRWHNQVTTFIEPGDPPDCEEQARFLRTCSPGVRCSTLERERVPALFPPRRQRPSAAADNPLSLKEIQETS